MSAPHGDLTEVTSDLIGQKTLDRGERVSVGAEKQNNGHVSG